MGRKICCLLFWLLCFTAQAFAYLQSPEELVDSFYEARRFQNKTKIILLTKQSRNRDFTKEGEELFKTRIISYTVVELKTIGNTNAYALVEVKTSSVKEGIRNIREYWKMMREDGIWSIENIFPNPDNLREFINPNWPLEKIVEKLIELDKSYKEYEVVVEVVVERLPADPIDRFNYFYRQKRYWEALTQADVIIAIAKNTGNTWLEAQATYFKGKILGFLGDQAGKEYYVDLAMKINWDAVYYLKAGGGGGSDGGDGEYGTYTEEQRRTVREEYDVDKMFTD